MQGEMSQAMTPARLAVACALLTSDSFSLRSACRREHRSQGAAVLGLADSLDCFPFTLTSTCF